jgi:cell division control protein 12
MVEKGFSFRLSVIDTPGFGDFLSNHDCWLPILNYIDDQNLNFLKTEQGLNRFKADDMRVHACLYFVQPTCRTLSSLDIKVMKLLGTKVNLIPIIAKADTLTTSARKGFKQRIRECIAENDIKVYVPPLDEENDPDTVQILASMPFSVIGSENKVEVGNNMVFGRQYHWGVAEGFDTL